MAFVRFTQTGRSFAPKASINPRGYLNFSDGARRRYNMDGHKFAVLYFDSELRQIGVELVNDSEAEGAVKLRIRKTGGAAIGAKSFVDFFDMKVSRTTMYDIKPGEAENWLVIDLKTARERNSKDDEDMGEDDAIS